MSFRAPRPWVPPLALLCFAACNNGDTPEGGAGSGGAAGTPAPTGTRHLVYLDISQAIINTHDLASSEAGTILEGVGTVGLAPDGVVIDHDAGHVYWTNMGIPSLEDGRVQRADLDGGGRVDIVASGDTMTPKQITLDAADGKLYWSDREGMRVMRANLDGSALETLVTVGEGAGDRTDIALHCVGIAVDHAGG